MKDALGHGSDTHGGEPETPVIYKKDGSGGVFAAFPTIAGDMDPGTMTGYAHVGQHSSYHQNYVSSAKPAKPEEYADLHSELKSIGYNLKVMRKMTREHYEERKRQLR